MEAVRLEDGEREKGSKLLAGAAGTAFLVVALVALSQTGGFSYGDSLLQTSQYSLAEAEAAQQPVVAQAMPVAQAQQVSLNAQVAQALPATQYAQPVQQAAAQYATQAVQPQAQMPAQAQVLQAPAAAPRQVLEGEAPADSTAESPSAGGVEGAVEQMVQPMLQPPAGPGVQGPPAPAAHPPQCPVGLSPCLLPSCGMNGACWHPDPTNPTGYTCMCLPPAPPPPPPIPGSQAWMADPENQVFAPPAAAVDSSKMFGEYETGKIAYGLDQYLAYSAQKAKAQAALGKLIFHEIEASQPCPLVKGGPTGYQCEDGSRPGEATAKKGLFGLGILGLAQRKASTTSSLAEAGPSASGAPSSAPAAAPSGTPMTVDQAHTFAKSLENIEEQDRSLPEEEQDDIHELQEAMKDYEGKTGEMPKTQLASLNKLRLARLARLAQIEMGSASRPVVSYVLTLLAACMVTLIL